MFDLITDHGGCEKFVGAFIPSAFVKLRSRSGEGQVRVKGDIREYLNKIV